MISREAAALRYQIFNDRDSDERVFADKFVSTRKQHACVICREPIPVGSRCRTVTGLSRTEGNNMMTFHCCPDCCDAMASAVLDPDDAGRAIERRTAIGMATVRARRAP